ncbi:hypothetical protein Taro_036069, partial [Colocasia esculenta]|nr:hypothetical protein [Colocasia esculenta]
QATTTPSSSPRRFAAEAGGELAATAREGHSGHPLLLPLSFRVSSTSPGVSCRPHRLLPPLLRSGRLASPAARSPVAHSHGGCAAVFLKIAYEGKEMRAMADELKVIDLHVSKVPQQKGKTECGFMVLYFIFRFILATPASFGTNDYPSFLTADWFSREEYEKFREDLQGKRIHIDA